MSKDEIMNNVILPQLNVVDWNALSKMGLIERINKEILHPLGLSMARDTDTGISPFAIVSNDGIWEYAKDRPSLIKSDEEVKSLIPKLSTKTNTLTQSDRENRYKRYVVFAYASYYPEGGLCDTKPEQSFSSLNEAIEWITANKLRSACMEHYQILDTVLRIEIELEQ